MARLNDIPVVDLQQFLTGNAKPRRNGPWSTLVDWAVPAEAGQLELQVTPERLDQFLQIALQQLSRSGGAIRFYNPEQSWKLTRKGLWRFWKRRQALGAQLA